MNDLLSVFSAHYSYTRWGETTTKAYVVVANTPVEALGLVLDAEPQTDAEDWKIRQIDLTKSEAHYIDSYN